MRRLTQADEGMTYKPRRLNPPNTSPSHPSVSSWASVNHDFWRLELKGKDRDNGAKERKGTEECRTLMQDNDTTCSTEKNVVVHRYNELIITDAGTVYIVE